MPSDDPVVWKVLEAGTVVRVRFLEPPGPTHARVVVDGREVLWRYSMAVSEQLHIIHDQFSLDTGRWDVAVRADKDSYERPDSRVPTLTVTPVPRRGE